MLRPILDKCVFQSSALRSRGTTRSRKSRGVMILVGPWSVGKSAVLPVEVGRAGGRGTLVEAVVRFNALIYSGAWSGAPAGSQCEFATERFQFGRLELEARPA